jgi:hypothetical protein
MDASSPIETAFMIRAALSPGGEYSLIVGIENSRGGLIA